MHEEGKLVEVEDIKIQKMNGNGMSVNRPFSMYKVWCIIKGYIWMKRIFIISI